MRARGLGSGASPVLDGPGAPAPQRRLALFLSNGKSLSWWKGTGLFSREIALYLRLLETGAFDRILVFSFDARDRGFLAELADQEPLYRRFELVAPADGRFHRVAGLIWGVYAAVRHRRTIATAGVLKTNQVDSLAAALPAALLTSRPLVFRMGYQLSRRFALNGHKLPALLARLLEGLGYRVAKRVLVTSREMEERLAANPRLAGKIVRTPTYVDVGLFTPVGAADFDQPLVAVGRLTPQKNLLALVRACAMAGSGLTLVGEGALEAELRALADALDVPLHLAGTVPNEALPALLRQHSLFILPSLHEGLPKVLIEAMAMGMICIGSRIDGITDLIRDGENGYLIDGFSPEAIAAAITRARDERATELGQAARRTVDEPFSLEGYADREAALYATLT